MSDLFCEKTVMEMTNLSIIAQPALLAEILQVLSFHMLLIRIRQDQDFITNVCVRPDSKKNSSFNLLLFFLPLPHPPLPPLYLSPLAPTSSSSSFPQHGRAEFSWEGINVSLLVFRSPSFHPPKSLTCTSTRNTCVFRAQRPQWHHACLSVLPLFLISLPHSLLLIPDTFDFFLPHSLSCCAHKPPCQPPFQPASSLGPPLIYCNGKLKIYTVTDNRPVISLSLRSRGLLCIDSHFWLFVYLQQNLFIRTIWFSFLFFCQLEYAEEQIISQWHTCVIK